MLNILIAKQIISCLSLFTFTPTRMYDSFSLIIAQKNARCVGEVHSVCFHKSLWIFLSIPAATRQMFVEIRNTVSSRDIYLLVISTWVDEYNCATKISHE